ncbi:MAG: SCO family protein [bacterium]|nr:SCO family protein [bacterium]
MLRTIFLVIMPLVAGSFSVPFIPLPALATEDPASVPREAGIDEHTGAELPLELQFTNADGQQKPLSEFFPRNKPVILTPVYYNCPRLCGLVLAGMIKVLNEVDLQLGEDFSIISVSFNPRETPVDAAKAHAKFTEMLSDRQRKGIDSWHFLTGTQDNINNLMQTIGYRYVEDRGEFTHAAAFVVVSPEGKISRYFYGVEHLRENMYMALLEAADGQIGSAFEQVVLYCFRFDPTKGKYTMAIMKVVRVFSLFTLALTAISMILLRLSEKRRMKRGSR